ncbi:MAG: guanine deaminase [Gammaproteobacteria bacterium]|jgi:guanine deaminase|nr:guanine deaminase [Gammaproteobacteria bacterium]MDH3758767.1 guanine deaminase [Gammaproteobacteria bacterium]MDH3846306.1 guanine deaminase [Gammaproteobacteria bacterium]MDH3904605.1 guanine deaminase [Gammaproteobacteria bacterium]MDH3908069.1 guanine deaminase [Gammaproteobacteria bacterium]
MRTAFRGSVFHCLADPGEQDDEKAIAWLEDGLLVVEDGLITELGEADALMGLLSDDTRVEDFSGKLIVPGLIDCHVHYPQIDVIASYGEELLDWLHRYAFPREMRFADEAYAREVASVFVDELLKNGTTTALVFGTVHAHSADAIFEAAAAKNMRLIAGKVLMDANCPEALRDSAATGYEHSKQLIERWHGKGRLGYAITPRFALTSSEAQLEAAGRLAAEYPDVWVHTHLAENHDEVEQISRLFPWSSSYLDVYDRFGLVRERSVFAHCLHVQDEECRLMAESGAAAAHCPTSNMFLGSGLFDLRRLREWQIRVGLGTDVGGGTSLSLLKTMREAYKVLHLQQQPLPPGRALYLATLGAAQALYLDNRIGNFETGKEADFIVLDPRGTSISAHRTALARSPDELLFALIVLGDDRNVAATYLQGLPA